jgi:hypothetical protein
MSSILKSNLFLLLYLWIVFLFLFYSLAMFSLFIIFIFYWKRRISFLLLLHTFSLVDKDFPFMLRSSIFNFKLNRYEGYSLSVNAWSKAPSLIIKPSSSIYSASLKKFFVVWSNFIPSNYIYIFLGYLYLLASSLIIPIFIFKIIPFKCFLWVSLYLSLLKI